MMRILTMVVAFVCLLSIGVNASLAYDLTISNGDYFSSLNITNQNVLISGGYVGQYRQTDGNLLITGGTLDWLTYFRDLSNGQVEIYGGTIGGLGTNQLLSAGPYYIHAGTIGGIYGQTPSYLYGYGFERHISYAEWDPQRIWTDGISGYWSDGTSFYINLGLDDGDPNAWRNLHLVEVTPVPLPGTLWLLCLGVIGLAGYGRKKLV